MELMRYKGFFGSVEASVEDGCLYGRLEFIDDLVTFEGETVAELESAFHEAVDDYLDTCQQLGREPQKPYRGSFNVRVGSRLHRAAAVAAYEHGMNLNEFVRNAIEHELSRE